MQSKVCTNCLKLLSTERRKNGYITCVGCENVSKDFKQNQSCNSVLHTSLKKDIEEQANHDTQQKEAQKKQQNKTDFFNNFKKIKNTAGNNRKE